VNEHRPPPPPTSLHQCIEWLGPAQRAKGRGRAAIMKRIAILHRQQAGGGEYDVQLGIRQRDRHVDIIKLKRDVIGIGHWSVPGYAWQNETRRRVGLAADAALETSAPTGAPADRLPNFRYIPA
jgi:hypothetical protein